MPSIGTTLITSATITGYTESVNANGELVISGMDGLTPVAQTLPIRPPCVIFYDTSNRNFYAVQDLSNISPTWQFLKFIKTLQ